ncbi:eukaryotic translation initiation factor 4E-like 1 [Pelagophyceae sp. CCMP2097]|nr:eukaryotic translation initiation factor 4E-like 1 [Pelagophyceae sp. CCMP2097]
MAAPNVLEHQWALWEHRTSEKKSMSTAEWSNLQKKVGTFSSVEDFWRHYAHIPAPSEVFYDGKARKRVGTAPNDRIIESFSIFKEGIAPEWEDAANKYGGEWNLRKSGRQGSPDDVDEWWANLVLGLVGETIDIGDHITGARVVDKSNGKGAHPVYRVELWLRTKDDAVKETIKKRLIDVMTEGRGAKNLGEQFQWKLHGV